MDDGRVSYKEAVEAIRRFGYLGIERNEDVVILYADGIPYASVKNTNYPLRTWDYERHDWITLEHCRTIDDSNLKQLIEEWNSILRDPEKEKGVQ